MFLVGKLVEITLETKEKKVKKLASQGDPKVIAAILNHHLKSEGIRAKVNRKNSCLYILLESQEVPDENQQVELVQGIIKSFKSKIIKTIKIGGRAQGQKIAAWIQKIKLKEIKKAQELSTWLAYGTDNFLANQESETTEETVVKEKFLRFAVGKEDTALLPLDSVKEILRLSPVEILPVPDMLECVLGLYNWRGDILWLVDLNQILGFPQLTPPRYDAATKLAIIVEAGGKILGLVVNQVDEIVEHNPNWLQPLDRILDTSMRKFVRGYFRSSNSLVLDATAIVQAPQSNHELQ